MSETARETIARLGSEVNGLKERLGMLTALHRGCAGIRAENARLRGDLDTALGLRRMESRRVDAVREQAESLAGALRNQGLLQNTFHGTVWHIHDCPASFDFSECHYRCRVAREAFALAGTEPYVSPETKKDTEVYE